jgi:hypothetical protein
MARPGLDMDVLAFFILQERVVQVSRVTKVVKGGKSMSFRYSLLPLNFWLCPRSLQCMQACVNDAKHGMLRQPNVMEH